MKQQEGVSCEEVRRERQQFRQAGTQWTARAPGGMALATQCGRPPMVSSERRALAGRRSFRGGLLSLCTPARSLPHDGTPCPFLPPSLQRRGSAKCVDREADSKDYCNRCPCRRMRAREATRGSQGAQEQSRSPEDVASVIRLTQLVRTTVQGFYCRRLNIEYRVRPRCCPLGSWIFSVPI